MQTIRTCLTSAFLASTIGCMGVVTAPSTAEETRDFVDGCDASRFSPRPLDPGQRGPWEVGARNLEIGDLTVEVLYPAAPGSLADQPPLQIDLRDALPESQRSLISDDKKPKVECDCYRNLPLDQGAGPYPLILFVHGTASWRTQSLSLMSHWASRGFIVAAADHPGLWLADLLAGICGEPVGARQDMVRDLRVLHDAFTGAQGELSFVSGSVDLDRIGIAGHSAGASAAAAAATLAGVQTVISLAGNRSIQSTARLSSALFLGGMEDQVIPFSQTQRAYENSDFKRRLVGIEGGGHLIFSDICELTNGDGQNLVEIATEAGVCGTQFAAQLFDCASSTVPPETAKSLVNATTTFVLERDLQCVTSAADFEEFSSEGWVEVVETRD